MRKPVYYGEYLKLNELLNTQIPESRKINNEAHDETLFIIVHQVYELWFKQIIHEMKSVHSIFDSSCVQEKSLAKAVSRLERVNKIQSLLIDQLDVMETMTPMDFLEFRDLLIPASGFQSVQFRMIEVLMGLRTNARKEVDRDYFIGRLSKDDQKVILDLENKSSILELTESWLERLPFTIREDFDFWKEYETSIENMMDADEEIINLNMATLDKKSLEVQIENLKSTRRTFKSLLNKEIHDKLINDGKRKLSQKATLNALFILLYRDEPILQLPYRYLTMLMEIDESFTTWRYRHAMMAHRMLGTKIGTGGSSGHHYLKMAAENNRVFLDLFDLSTFLIPRTKLPVLPNSIKEELGFNFS